MSKTRQHLPHPETVRFKEHLFLSEKCRDEVGWHLTLVQLQQVIWPELILYKQYNVRLDKVQKALYIAFGIQREVHRHITNGTVLFVLITRRRKKSNQQFMPGIFFFYSFHYRQPLLILTQRGTMKPDDSV